MKRIYLLLLAFTLLFTLPLAAASIPKMDKDELKNQLGSENVVVVDVRTGRDWSASEFKIKGAVRVNDGDLTALESNDKEQTFVLYCA